MNKINWLLLMTGMAAAAVVLADPEVTVPNEATPLLACHFDGETEGWVSVDQVSVVAVATREEYVRAGGGSLEFTYILPRPEQVQQGKALPALLAPLNADLKAARSLRFWLRTDQPAAMVVLLSEADGSHYDAALYSPADTWQQVALSLDRFTLGDDSTDENDRLDPDQIRSVGFIDASFFLSSLNRQPVAQEDRQFWLDEFEVLSEEVPSAYGLDRENPLPIVLDDFESGFLPWLPILGDLSLDEDHPATPEPTEASLPPNQHSMLWEHEGPAGQMVGLIRPFHLLPLQGFTQLRLWVKSSVATTLALSFEEVADGTGDKSSYYHPFPVQAGEWQEIILPLKGFTRDEGKRDDNHQLDLNEVETMFLLDAGAILGQTPSASIWIDGIVLE